MNGTRKWWWMGGIVVALVLVYAVGSGEGWIPSLETITQPAALYHIASAEEIWPKFTEAEIDPLKVSVGGTQKMRIVLENADDIIEVKAIVKTDNQTLEIPLTQTSRRAVTRADIESKKYEVQDHKLVINDQSPTWRSLVDHLVQSASAADTQRFEYAGSWVVHDTHDEVYYTTFEAKDAKGRMNSITMAWSDPCSPPLGTAWSVTASQTCDTSPTGPDNSGIAVSGAGVNLVVGTGSALTLVWGPGQSITISNGAQMSISSSAQVKQQRIYVGYDADNDGYISNLQSFSRSLTGGTGYVLGASSPRASQTSLLSGDCNDTRSAVYPGSTHYGTNTSGWTGTYGGSYPFSGGDYDCNGSITDLSQGNNVSYSFTSGDDQPVRTIYEAVPQCVIYLHGSCGQQFNTGTEVSYYDSACTDRLYNHSTSYYKNCR